MTKSVSIRAGGEVEGNVTGSWSSAQRRMKSHDSPPMRRGVERKRREWGWPGGPWKEKTKQDLSEELNGRGDIENPPLTNTKYMITGSKRS